MIGALEFFDLGCEIVTRQSRSVVIHNISEPIDRNFEAHRVANCMVRASEYSDLGCEIIAQKVTHTHTHTHLLYQVRRSISSNGREFYWGEIERDQANS